MTAEGRVLVAMSGGVDSSVAAATLKEAGHDVVGVFMRNGVQASGGRRLKQGCCSVEDARDARRVAEQLDIPFYAMDFEAAFDVLIDDFSAAYAEGRTPNPCIECNKRFKTGALGHTARKLGARWVATGHHARKVQVGDRHALQVPVEAGKDQSYVLYSLDQETLAHLLLPIGELTKDAVREEARRLGLTVAEKPESMEICFVPTGDYRDVLATRRPDVFRPGRIVDTTGRDLGPHGGTALFTIGQRRGLPGGQGSPLYVVDLLPEKDLVVVGPRSAAGRESFLVGNLCIGAQSELPEGTSVRGRVKVRSQHRPVPAAVTFETEGRARVQLEAPEPGIAPGQAAVLYDEADRVLLGGTILRDPTPRFEV